MEAQDKLQKIYESIVEEEHKTIQKKHPTIIEEMIRRIEELEEQVKLLKG
jgi:hypothetical protein